MKEEGDVIAAANGKIKVKILRKSACGGDCRQCGASCSAGEHIIETENKINANIGDRVFVEMPAEKVLKIAFLVYIIPLIAMILGYYLTNCFVKSDVICVLSGLFFMIISFFLLHIYDKCFSRKHSNVAVFFAHKNDENSED